MNLGDLILNNSSLIGSLIGFGGVIWSIRAANNNFKKSRKSEFDQSLSTSYEYYYHRMLTHKIHYLGNIAFGEDLINKLPVEYECENFEQIREAFINYCEAFTREDELPQILSESSAKYYQTLFPLIRDHLVEYDTLRIGIGRENSSNNALLLKEFKKDKSNSNKNIDLLNELMISTYSGYGSMLDRINSLLYTIVLVQEKLDVETLDHWGSVSPGRYDFAPGDLNFVSSIEEKASKLISKAKNLEKNAKVGQIVNVEEKVSMSMKLPKIFKKSNQYTNRNTESETKRMAENEIRFFERSARIRSKLMNLSPNQK